MLEQISWKVHYRPGIVRKEILTIIHQYEGLIVRSKTAIDQEIIDKAVKLKWVARAGAGLDKLDISLLENRGVKILNAPEGNRDALGEHALSILLTLLNKVHIADQEVRQGKWNREAMRGTELMGKTVGIIGYGNMGQAFARRLQGFGVEVLAYDKYRKSYGNQYAQEACLGELFEQTDILSLHVPLTDETYFMLDASFLHKFNKSIYLLNTARGKNISLKTLVTFLKSGKIIGAALDVLENEKIDQFTAEQQMYFDQLKQMKQVVLTPHVGGWTNESYKKINQVLISKIKDLN